MYGKLLNIVDNITQSDIQISATPRKFQWCFLQKLKNTFKNSYGISKDPE